MKKDFDVSVTRHADTIEVTLHGNFDASSARQLIEVLKKNSDGVHFAFVQTDGVQKIEPEGEQAFQEGLNNLKDFGYRLSFSGKNAFRIHSNIMDPF